MITLFSRYIKFSRVTGNWLLIGWLFLFGLPAIASNANTLYVYNWANYMPDEVIRQFEKETGIHVHYSTYDSNETLYAKLKSNQNAGYDIAVPSTYFLDRMRKEGMLQKIDKTQLPNFKNLNPDLLNQVHDPKNDFSIPYLWGTTGVVLNSNYYPKNSVTRWADLWAEKYRDQLLLIDDQRDVFSMALKTLGYSVNDTNPEHIKQAYLKLKALMANVRLFNAEAIQALYIDEDVTIGMGLSGDIYLAQKENPQLNYVYPAEGVILWLDSLVIPKGAKHLANAYKLLNFLLRPDIAAKISMSIGYSSPNLAALKLLPLAVRNNPIIYPRKTDLRHGEFQADVGEANILYEKYWELLKIGG